MWLLERLIRPAHLVRAGREHVELYRRTRDGLALERSQRIEADKGHHANALAAALVAVLTDGQEAAAGTIARRGGQGRRLDVVLESSWLPVMLLPTGARPWTSAQLQTLMRHRLAMLYGDADDQPATWDLCVDHRAGDAHALGYSLAPSVKAAIRAATATTGCRLASVQPGFAWGLKYMHGHRPLAHRSWWAWLEQDRTLIARIERHQVVALNPAADMPPAAPSSIEAWWNARIHIEAARNGFELDARNSVVVLGWEPQRPAADTGKVIQLAVTHRPDRARPNAPATVAAG